MEKEPTAWAGLSTCPLHSWASTSFRCVLNAFPLKLSICQVKKWAPVLASQWGGLWAADSASLGGSARRYGFLVSTYPLQGCLLVCVCVCVCALSCVCMCSLDCSPDVTPHHTHTHTSSLQDLLFPTPQYCCEARQLWLSLAGPLPTLCGPWCVGGLMKPRCRTPDSGRAAAAWRNHLPPTVSGPSCSWIPDPRNSWKAGPSYRQASVEDMMKRKLGFRQDLEEGPWKVGIGSSY